MHALNSELKFLFQYFSEFYVYWWIKNDMNAAIFYIIMNSLNSHFHRNPEIIFMIDTIIEIWDFSWMYGSTWFTIGSSQWEATQNKASMLNKGSSINKVTQKLTFFVVIILKI